MDENLQLKHTSSIFINHISPIMVFKCVLENKILTWIIQLSFFQAMKYIDLVYDLILTASNDMENIVIMS
jgi:hypothetical protein